MPYPGFFGGVFAIRREHWEKINGASNQFWGWGGEDDDIFRRIVKSGLTITRYAAEVARYATIEHEQAVPSKEKDDKLRTGIAR